MQHSQDEFGFIESGQADVILLDYVQTLVANNDQKFKAFKGKGKYNMPDWIAMELYRNWLVKLLAEFSGTVLLVTARSTRWQDLTVQRICDSCRGWQPDEYFFNELHTKPPQAKQHALDWYIFRKYGSKMQTRYLALESNASTRAMYRRNGIQATPVPYGDSPVWTEFPDVK